MFTMIIPRASPPPCSPNIIPNSRYIPTGIAIVNSMNITLVTVIQVVCSA